MTTDTNNKTPDAPEWRPIPGASLYEVSSAGHLRSLRTIDPSTGEPYQMTWSLSDGYCASCIRFDDGSRRTVFAHTVVALAFLGPRPEGLLVLHRDDVRTNNDLRNLRYGTRADNARDARRNGSHLPHDPEGGNVGDLSAATVRAVRHRVNDGESVSAIAKALKLSYGTVYRIATGKAYTRIADTCAAQERARLMVRAQREQARLERDTRRSLAAVEALERVAPPEGQRRRKAPHTVAAAAASARPKFASKKEPK